MSKVLHIWSRSHGLQLLTRIQVDQVYRVTLFRYSCYLWSTVAMDPEDPRKNATSPSSSASSSGKRPNSTSAKRCPTARPVAGIRKLSIVSCSSVVGGHIPEINGKGGPGQADRGEAIKGNMMGDLAHSESIYVLKRLIWSMRILGLWPKEGETFFKRMNPQSWIVFSYLHIYALHNIANWIFAYHRNMGFHIFLENASMVIRTGATAVTFNLFFIKYHESLQSLIMVSYFPFVEDGISLLSLKTPIRGLVFASWCYLIMVLGFTSWSMATMGIQKFMDYYFYGFRVGHVDAVLMRFLMAGVWFAHIAITLSAEIFLKSFYVASCLILGKTARAYNEMVADFGDREQISGQDINRVNRLHTQLTDLVLGVDKNFSKPAFIWIATIFLNLCTKIGVICVTTDPSWISNASLDIMNYLVIFIVISLTAADVSLQCEVLLPLAHNLAGKCDMKNLTVLYQAKLMIAKMSHPVAKLTGWRCFVLDRPFILTILGTILTYSVVLMQMSRSMNSSGEPRGKENFLSRWINATVTNDKNNYNM